ncbi:MAG: ABC transporter, partial [Fuerstiella sp.]|nr:ABC transporter [Fuerstiella sp.]
MKDVEALCDRAIVINKGAVIHDGALADIVDRFSQHKIIELHFASDSTPNGIDRYGVVLEDRPPMLRLQVEKQKVSAVLSQVLAEYSIEDVSVSERPVEDVIAELFSAQGN